MNTAKTYVLLLVLCTACLKLGAQQNPSMAAQRAVLFADSLEQTFLHNNFEEYINLSYPGVIKYYGGKDNFLEYLSRTRSNTPNQAKEGHEKVELVQMVDVLTECQCVIRKTCSTIIDGRRAEVISYMVGQSKDHGKTWKYFDVNYNSMESVVYVMPDIFEQLSIPQRQIVFEKDQLASKS